MNIFESVQQILKNNAKKYYSKSGELLRNALYEDVMKMDPVLLKSLYDNLITRERFFKKIGEYVVFDKVEFGWIINNRSFFPDSYTRYANKIGLSKVNGSLISSTNDVVIAFPYKDCVLEGGQTREEQKRSEIFYSEILASDEVDRLLAPKAFVNARRYQKSGWKKAKTISNDDNLVIKGNNLLALASLLERYEGKIRCIYLDPPYNTGSDDFHYNDSFNHSTYLTFIKNRLELARRLLAENGSIYVQLDYNEVHYVKVLMDEIFGRECFQREIIWDTQVLSGYKTIVNNWVRGHDSILFYTKNPKGFLFNKQKMEHRKEYLDRFDKIDKDGRRYFDGRGKVTYLDEVIEKGKAVGDVWYDIMSFQQIPTAKERVKFSTQKPEALLRRIIQSSTNEGDIVLDFFSGSGTTGVVAHKLGRKYIMCEQLESQLEIQLERLVKVVDGTDQGKLADELNWKGGGSFLYMELAKLNENYIDAIQKAKTPTKLINLYKQILSCPFLNYKVTPTEINAEGSDFKELSLDEQKRLLMELLDKNQLYVSYCDMKDSDLKLSKDDIAISESFYEV